MYYVCKRVKKCWKRWKIFISNIATAYYIWRNLFLTSLESTSAIPVNTITPSAAGSKTCTDSGPRETPTASTGGNDVSQNESKLCAKTAGNISYNSKVFNNLLKSIDNSNSNQHYLSSYKIFLYTLIVNILNLFLIYTQQRILQLTANHCPLT